jgi:hypothetical protein
LLSFYPGVNTLFIHQLGRSRWRIDAEVFQTITTDCYLKHPAVHQSTALVVLTMIRLLAYTLSLIFSTDRSAAMPAAVVTASTNAPSAWPTGSSPFRLTPVDSTAVPALTTY